MAGRNIKEGLDYFKLDVNYGSEDAVELIDSEFGPPGYRIITKLIQRIYGKKGYFIDWNEKRRILFASAVKEKASLVDEVVARSVKWGLFNESVFNKFGILTSADIQINYLDAAKRRDRVEIIREISLSDISAHGNAIYVNMNSICVNINEQSRVEESTGEKSRVQQKNTGAPAAPTEPKKDGDRKEKKQPVVRAPFIPPTLQQVKDYFLKKIGDPADPRSWPEHKCFNEAEGFWDHYKSNGWVQGRGKPIKDWEASVRIWIRNALKGVFEKPEYVAKEKPAERRREEVPQLNKVQEELNYLFEHWLEDNTSVTIISIGPEHYNFLKSAHLVNFSEAEIADIRRLTVTHMQDNKLEGQNVEIRLMKAYGVLEFFKQLKTQGKETIFTC